MSIKDGEIRAYASGGTASHLTTEADENGPRAVHGTVDTPAGVVSVYVGRSGRWTNGVFSWGTDPSFYWSRFYLIRDGVKYELRIRYFSISHRSIARLARRFSNEVVFR